MESKQQEDGVIDETNFRETAKKAVKRYQDKGALLDAVFWARIIGLYEAELVKKGAPGGKAEDIDRSA